MLLKQFSTLLCILHIGLNSICQTNNFAPIGATWWYSTSEWEAMGGPLKISCSQDTIINGKTCSVLDFNVSPNGVTFTDSLFMHQQDSQIFRYIPQLDSFYLQYDFNLNPGDNYYCFTLSPSYTLDSLLVTITDTSTVIINEVTLKKQLIQTFGQYDWGSEIIEVIGNNQMIVPVHGLIDIIEGPLRCYEDDYLNLYETGIVSSCEDLVSITTELEKVSISMYPNPTDNLLNIILTHPIEHETYSLHILSATGSQLYTASLSPNSLHTLDLANIQHGLLFVQVLRNKQLIYADKILHL